MGLIKELFSDFASIAGDTGRQIWTESREKNTITGDVKERLEAFIKQAENGDVQAMLSLGCWYQEGTTLRYDPRQACYWWTKAAQAGSVDAMYNLGLLYNGDLAKSFPPDDKQAVYWLSEAAARGRADARQVLEEDFKWSLIFKKWVRK